MLTDGRTDGHDDLYISIFFKNDRDNPSYRHQFLFVYYLSSPHFLKNDEYEYGPIKTINNELNEIIKSLIDDFSEISNVKWVEYNNIKYTPNDIIIEPRKNNFAQIKNIIITKNKQIHLIFREFDRLRYSPPHNAIILNENENLQYKSCLLTRQTDPKNSRFWVWVGSLNPNPNPTLFNPEYLGRVY